MSASSLSKYLGEREGQRPSPPSDRAQPGSKPLLDIRALSLAIGDRTILDRVSLTIAPG